jgi:hypothetical protein
MITGEKPEVHHCLQRCFSDTQSEGSQPSSMIGGYPVKAGSHLGK